MIDTDRRSPEALEEQAERVEEDADAMDRPDRAIPLPQDGEDEGVGPITTLVP
ncbi:hypothetical protein GGQ87_001488 [Brevundimonas alba]|uniref:Uncharacterized protein n=1 Tax=Brevundimonas alba TaxID=74314 RepID=A0A7X5YME6_9CAUL|nr:hypothetical protein [Brevundimonas alba]NJC41230.1 hypothetical protein [Brevundimonas alba]